MTVESVDMRTGDTYVVPECTFEAPEGKVFSHWNTRSDGTGVSYNPGQKIKLISKELKLFAQWRILE